MTEMNAQVLLNHFDRIAEAPDAVPRLRQFILDLAVRGKLVEQDEGDEPANELAKRIKRSLNLLVQQGEIKKKKALPDINEDEIPFDIPNSWQWVRLSNIASYIQRGKSPKYSSGDGMPVISQKCVQWSGLDMDAAKKITSESIKSYEPIRFLQDCDLLWNSTGTGTIGRVLRLSKPQNRLICDSHVTVVRCLGVDSEYIRTWLRSDHVYGLIESRAAGSTNQIELTAQLANMQVVPLPPLAEQRRIVAKVDELMALCDRLEGEQANREEQRDSLVKASLHRLNQPPQPSDQESTGTAVEYQEHVRFHLEHLPKLLTKPEHVKELRQSILNLAVRGKLVPQDPNDEPAAKLLERINSKRLNFLKCGYPNQKEASTQIRKQKQQALPKTLEKLPFGWSWATLMQCALIVVDCHNKTAPYVHDGIKLIRTTNVKNGELVLEDIRYVDNDTFERWSARCKPEPGDILITREAPMGEVCIIPSGTTICLGQRMMLIRLVKETIEPKFLLYSLRDPYFMERVQNKPVGATVQHLRVGGVETLLVPLPPLAEQQRIVAKLDGLMIVCDQLENELAGSQDQGRRLLEAVLHEALGEDKPIPAPLVKATTKNAPPAPKATPAKHAKKTRQGAAAASAPATPDSTGAILAHMQPGQTYTRADITEALGLSVGTWNSAIRDLKEKGLVVQTGQKRGARYSLADPK